ncbi:SWIB/MDM2 domain containing protein [Parasponia andersonii]|uniref:SWIB/MDM2 domain containing protein n=1 Tax=Parasponia andersonii TaxID=3476 RepID=A0A2P5BK71_PARAD|nr:SWIB/MDM2 domain containing protein [Parasponia andersonii]
MVSDADLVTRLRDILRNSDLDTTTPSSVRRQLEADFGVDLSDRKAFIREQIDIFLESHLAKPQDQEVEVEEEEEDQGDKRAEVAEDENDADDEENEDESEGKGSGKGGSNKKDKVKKRGGFNKLCSLSPQLQEVVGEPELSRPESKSL